MWLLDTHSLELRLFQTPPTLDNGEPYAILSHVWSVDGEQSFQELNEIFASMKATQALAAGRSLQSDERISAKVRDCCAFARSMGYRLHWIDSCCIDKTSSAELSEAINSMYDWYTRAGVCFAFLYDVDDRQDPSAPGSDFRRSRWFTRGWTLQELIAPRDVLFLSKDWRMLGTKEDLAIVIEETTGVNRAVLLFEETPASVSVAARMSWASKRVTTRLEDEAYSLLGLFGICMPTLYGEGRNAFLRLQEEILRQIPDQTIFVWGAEPETLIDETKWDAITPFSSPTARRFPTMDVDMYGRQYGGQFGHSPQRQYLFADTPSLFRNSARISPITLDTLAERLGTPIDTPHYIFTSYGVRMRLPTLPGKDWLDDSYLAVLACQDDQGRLVALILNKDGGRERHHSIGFPRFRSNNSRAVLLCTPLAQTDGQTTRVTPVDVCIAHRPAFQGTTAGGAFGFVETRRGWRKNATFRGPCTVFVPRWILAQLEDVGCVPSWTTGSDSLFVLETPSAGPRTIVFSVPHARLRFAISIALCSSPPADWVERGVLRYSLHAALTHWDEAQHDSEPPPAPGEVVAPSDCAEEHVANWTGAARTWGIPTLGSVTIEFKNWPCGNQSSGAMTLPLFAMVVSVHRDGPPVKGDDDCTLVQESPPLRSGHS